MVAVIWVVLFLLAVVWFWWFRRTPMYRAHRQIGVFPNTWSARSSSVWHGSNRPPLRPDLRPEAHQMPPSSRRWWPWHSRPSGSNNTP